VDLNERRVDILISDEEIAARRAANPEYAIPPSQSPWQELFRQHVGQLSDGACLEFAVKYKNLGDIVPRHNH
jgi:dihydroxy-acid dehydratase